MTSAPFLAPLSAAGALGFRVRRLGATATATATAVSVPPSSPGLRPGSAFFRFTASFLAVTRQSFVKRHECASLPSRTRLRKPHDLDHRLLCRVTIGVHVRVRVAVERLALLVRSEEHTSELQSHSDLVCRLLLEKKNKNHAH